jgi:PBP1b-binding outer membrane lipoprotein LpoB
MKLLLTLCCAATLLAGCVTNDSVYENRKAKPTVYRDIESRSAAGGIGLEARDITSVTDELFRDLISSGMFNQRKTPPRILIDSKHLINQSSARIDKDVLTDTLRTRLVRASLGKIYFVSRESIGIVEKERKLKRDGVVDTGSRSLAKATAGVDFFLRGRISSLDQVNSSTGVHDRAYSMSFELVDMEQGIIAYAMGPYQFAKFGNDDVIYR